jgi:signal transduction histidine kinase
MVEVEDTAQSFSPLDGAGPVVFLVDDDPLPANVDRDQLVQVLQNLVINAVQSMPGGGTITIRAANAGPTTQGVRLDL